MANVAPLQAVPARRLIFGRALIRRLFDHAADLTAIPADELMSKARTRDIAWTRFAIMAVAREEGKSMVQIANFFGMADHTAVRHGVIKAVELEAQDEEFAELMRRLRIEARR